MKRYEFQIIVTGCGNTPEGAWSRACESIAANGLGEFEEDSIVHEEELEID